jgi:4-amino-4-deoxy-L-arabinose transferase-like glycosyltransferase
MLRSIVGENVIEESAAYPSQQFIARALAWRMLPLTVILTLQASVSLITLNNSAFQDEALYLYTGRQLLGQYLGGPQVVDPFATYMSGHPDIYPLLAGALDMVGGLTLARLFSLVVMLTATACVFWITYRIFSRQAAILGTALFAMQGPVLFLSRLATYDAMCLGLLAVCAVLAFKLSSARFPWLVLAIGPLMALAFFTKYAFLLWAPSILAIIALETWRLRGVWSAVIRVFLSLVAIAVSGALIYLIFGPSFLHALVASTLQRQTTGAQLTASRPDLLWVVVSYIGIGLGIAAVGFALAPRGKRLLCWLFMGTSVLAPAYHIYHAEPVSLVKHLAYGMVFAAPLAGMALQRMIEWQARQNRHEYHTSLYSVAMLPIFLIVFTLGQHQGVTQYTQWSNSSQMISVMRSLVRPASGHYMAEDMEVTRYYLQDVTEDWQWTGPFWFQYVDNYGQTLYGDAAYVQAIHNGYFDAIELSYGVSSTLDNLLRAKLIASPDYQLVGHIFYRNDNGAGFYDVWRFLPKHKKSST